MWNIHGEFTIDGHVSADEYAARCTAFFRRINAAVQTQKDSAGLNVMFHSPSLLVGHSWHLLACVSNGEVAVSAVSTGLSVKYRLSMKRLIATCLLFSLGLPLVYVLGDMPMLLIPAGIMIIWGWMCLFARVLTSIRIRSSLRALGNGGQVHTPRE